MKATDHPLRVWRLSRSPRVTLIELAKQVGATPTHLSEIETGNNGASLPLAVKLSRATGGDVGVEKFIKPGSEAAA